jgi:hypothetical protein
MRRLSTTPAMVAQPPKRYSKQDCHGRYRRLGPPTRAHSRVDVFLNYSLEFTRPNKSSPHRHLGLAKPIQQASSLSFAAPIRFVFAGDRASP